MINVRPQSFACWLMALVTGLIAFESPTSAQALKDHDSYQALDIESDRIEVRERDGRAVLKGNVRVVQGKLTLTADALVVFYSQTEGDTDPTLERLDATGNVRLVSDTETVESDYGIYDVAARLVTLTGAVTLKRDGNILNGERLELNLISGLAKLDADQSGDGRVKGRFKAPPLNDKKS